MAKIGRELLDRLSNEGVQDPFVTIMINTNVTPQGVEKDQLKIKNFMKEAKKRFDKRYPDQDWEPFQEKFDDLLNDRTFFRDATTSVAIILTAEETYIHRLSIRVDDQYYVGDTPYLLAIIKNAQFNYRYYLMALNRSSMSLYFMSNKTLSEVELPEDAPTDLETALGTELTGGDTDFRSGLGYHSGNPKDEEVEIDWNNYYQAIDSFLRNEVENEEKVPLYLFALTENQTAFKKNAKYNYYDPSIAISRSPAQLSTQEIEEATGPITEELSKREIESYQKLMNRKSFEQVADIKQAAELGRVDQFFIATSNLQENFGEDPEAEYDWRQVLNTIARDVLRNSGDVFVLEQEDAPGEKSLYATLRY